MDTQPEKKLPQLLQPPVQSWQNSFFEKAGIGVDVLRLDLIHPIIGGNKWMKLKGFIQQALANGQTGIVTKGGPWSNHIHACAWLCHQLNLQCHVWIKGNSNLLTPMLKDAISWNAAVQFINRALFYDDTSVLDYARANNLLYVPMGGADAVGVEHVAKFMQQLQLPVYDYAICAVGTATTFGGLATIPENFQRVIGTEVGTNDELVLQKTKDWQQVLPHKKLTLIDDYDFGGFAKYTPALIHFMNDLHAAQQIPTDIVYTGKLFHAVQQLAAINFLTSGARVLVIHSGGLQGNRSLPAATLQF